MLWYPLTSVRYTDLGSQKVGKHISVENNTIWLNEPLFQWLSIQYWHIRTRQRDGYDYGLKLKGILESWLCGRKKKQFIPTSPCMICPGANDLRGRNFNLYPGLFTKFARNRLYLSALSMRYHRYNASNIYSDGFKMMYILITWWLFLYENFM